jgi:hypothetical protein
LIGPEETPVICVHCGQELPDTANFCLHCGRRPRPAFGGRADLWDMRFRRAVIVALTLFIGFLLLMYFDIIHFTIELANQITVIWGVLGAIILVGLALIGWMRTRP